MILFLNLKKGIVDARKKSRKLKSNGIVILFPLFLLKIFSGKNEFGFEHNATASRFVAKRMSEIFAAKNLQQKKRKENGI